MVVQKGPIEPHTGDDKVPVRAKPLVGKGFEVTGLNNSLKEQLDGFAAIGIQVVLPRLGFAGNCWGEQPPPCRAPRWPEVGPAKGRVAQQSSVTGT